MKMKKLTATILSGVMAVSLTACGGGDNKAADAANSAATDTKQGSGQCGEGAGHRAG